MLNLRYRHLFIIVTCVIALGLLLLTDPDAAIFTDLPVGATTVRAMATVFAVFFYVGVLHFGRKALTDYADLQVLYEQAKKSPEGAGLFAIAIGGIYVSIALVAIAAMVKF